MIKCKIIYTQFLDDYGDTFKIGGVETYIKNLISVAIDSGFEVEIYQISKVTFVKQIYGATIFGVCKNKGKTKISDLVKEASKNSSFNNDILIFATDLHIVNSNFEKVIAIQHGLAWDITDNLANKDLSNYLCILKGVFRTIKKYRRYKKCTGLICVDYNFINWYRTQIKHIDTKIHVIPNFTYIPEYNNNKLKDSISIIFARRLYEYRGTRIFCEAIKNILSKYENVNITIAGEGPDEYWMKKKLSEYKNVRFIKYASDESIKVHSQYDIAVVPTKGSEGTSLALLEAMAAGCSIVCTYVGGLSNIILNGYNGLIVEPNSENVQQALEKLINDKELRNYISQKGYESVKYSFSIDRWKEEWRVVFNSLCN